MKKVKDKEGLIDEKKIVKKPIKLVKKVEKAENIKASKEKSSQNQATFSILEVIVIIIITGLIVSVCSGLIVYNNYEKFYHEDNYSDTSKLDEFINSYDHILNSYVNDVDEGELIDAAIKGMYDYLNDAYSIYIDENTTETLNERLKGEYSGVGIEITMNENSEILVSRVFSDTPAEEAGLKAGDIIFSLDNESLEGKTSSDLSNTIKTSDKAEFLIGYRRDGVETQVLIQRKLVYIDSVSSEEYDNVGYIKIETFSATTADQVKNKLNSFSSNIDSLIIDVRDNSGGYLSSAYETSELLVGKGKIVYQLKDKEGNIDKKYSSIKALKNYNKVVVLINEASASASEILACALIDNLDAIAVGKTSYGKGTVQETENLSSGAMVKYTAAYWLTPNGESINGVGIIPNYEINQDNLTADDEQLLKALEIIK